MTNRDSSDMTNRDVYEMFYLKDVTLLLLVAFLVRVGYALFFVEPEYLLTEDQGFYAQLAQDLPNNDIFGLMPERAPGYPLFIAAIYILMGEGVWNVILIQILLDSISCVMIALTAQSLFNKGFWIAGVLSAINLNMIILSASLLTDTLFLFLFILYLFSLVKYLQIGNKKWFFLLVLFISLATLVRAASYYLLPILLVGLVSWKLHQRNPVSEIVKLFFLYLVVVGTLLGSIHYSNYQQHGSLAFVSQTGNAVLKWVVPATYQYSGMGSYQDGQKLANKRLDLALQQGQLLELPLNPFESSLYQANVGKDILFEFGFLNVLKAWAVGSVINLLAPSVAHAPALRAIDHPSFYETEGNGIIEKLFNYIKNSSGFLYLSILAVGTIISIIFTMFALAGIFKMILALPPITITTLLLLVGYFLTITGPIIGVKYRLPIEPILTLFVTYFLNKIDRKKPH
jgi:4-amino-4-deoxy-L-arabinose transferase-like glycosyltransferase